MLARQALILLSQILSPLMEVNLSVVDSLSLKLLGTLQRGVIVYEYHKYMDSYFVFIMYLESDMATSKTEFSFNNHFHCDC